MSDIDIIYPDLQKIKIGEKTYKVKRLSLKLLMDILRIFQKIIKKIDLSKDLTDLNALVPIIMGINEAQDDIIELIARLLDISKEEAEELAIDDVIKVFKIVDKQDKISEKLKDFFKAKNKVK